MSVNRLYHVPQKIVAPKASLLLTHKGPGLFDISLHKLEIVCNLRLLER